ncbi:Cap15 family cyclic dinucleotide receptor domain-containing protein [Kitasatospora cineracea]|uniref:Cap15 family cyclic dinucleotide receptor domain-containing protein n=1 Tax=Kitasatospora cineracea TaxID=88074 RepID=UPI0036BC7350
MSPATTVRTTASLLTTAYTVALPLLGITPTQNAKYLFAYFPSLIGYGLLVFDKWAWRWWGIHRLTGHPWVGGTWRSILKPAPESHIPPGGNRGPITTYLTIEQTYWTLHATLRTAESMSRSNNATIVKTDGSGIAEVRFLYENVPRTEHQARSPRHTGSCQLSVTGRAPRSIEGSYFTSRFTAGDMDLTLVDRSTEYGTFAEAQTADQRASATP